MATSARRSSRRAKESLLEVCPSVSLGKVDVLVERHEAKATIFDV